MKRRKTENAFDLGKIIKTKKWKAIGDLASQTDLFKNGEECAPGGR